MARATRQLLLDTAVELLINEGRSGITTGRLAREAGVVQSGFYNHFSSVDECVKVALDEVRHLVIATADLIMDDLLRPGDRTPRDVERIVAGIFERAAANPSPYKLLVQRHQGADIAAAVEDALVALRSRLAATILDEGSRTKLLSEREAATAAHLAVGVFLAGLESVLAGDDPSLVSRASAIFMMYGVFRMAEIDLSSPADQEINPAAG